MTIYTVSQKKFPPLNSVALSNLNRFSKFLHARKLVKFATKHNITHLTLGILYTTLGYQKFRLSANIQQI